MSSDDEIDDETATACQHRAKELKDKKEMHQILLSNEQEEVEEMMAMREEVPALPTLTIEDATASVQERNRERAAELERLAAVAQAVL